MRSIVITNHHTPYTVLLANVFDSVYVLKGFDRTQAEVPENCRLIGYGQYIGMLLSAKGVALISNSAPRDLFILMAGMILGSRTYVVVHGNIKHGWGSKKIGYILKKTFYRLLAWLINEKNMVTISNHAKKSLGLENVHVVRPYVEICHAATVNHNTKLVISSNDIWRNHFDKSMIEKLSKLNKFEIHVCGRGNSFLKNLCKVHEFENSDDYFNFLRSCKYTINILKEPESNYNISFLDCLKSGAIPLWIDRKNDEVEKIANTNQVVSEKDFSSGAIFKKIEFLQDENNDALLRESADLFLDVFSKSRFRVAWNKIVKLHV